MLIDPTGRIVSLQQPAQRIVSLIPSLTETLFAIGAGKRLVGVSNYCIAPANEVQLLPKVGGQKNPDFAKIAELTPDLLLLNREENRLSDYQRLAEKYPVYVSDVRRVSDVPDLLRDLGILTDCYEAAGLLAKRTEDILAQVSLLTRWIKPLRAITLIWHKPLMTTNGDTYLSDMMKRAGFVNPFFDCSVRYPEISIEDIRHATPDWILFPSEPHHWSPEEISGIMQSLTECHPEIRFHEIDGEAVTWYGARTAVSLEKSIMEFVERIHQRGDTRK
ncbi:MAG: helical backbone metal receptor [bacterium]|nr:helical backbone metal receptor [bacterium]